MYRYVALTRSCGSGRYLEMHAMPVSFRRNRSETPAAASRCTHVAAKLSFRWQSQLREASRFGIKLITMIRKPLPWLLSYWSLKHDRRLAIPDKVKRFTVFATSSFATNFQLAFLVGKRLPGPFFTLAYNTTTTCQARPLSAHVQEATVADLHFVLKLVSSGLLLAGTTEAFADTVHVFAKGLGWHRGWQHHLAKRRSQIPPSRPSSGSDLRFRNGYATNEPLTRQMLPPGLAEQLSKRSDLDMRLHEEVEARLPMVWSWATTGRASSTSFAAP